MIVLHITLMIITVLFMALSIIFDWNNKLCKIIWSILLILLLIIIKQFMDFVICFSVFCWGYNNYYL